MENFVNRQKKHFESVSNKYFHARQDSNHLYLKKLMWDHFFNLIDFGDKKKLVLEPMCGYAEGYELLSSRFKIEYTGFDFSQPLVDKVKEINPGLNVFLGDVTKFNPDKEYDIVIIIGGLHHVFRYVDDVLKMVNRSLKVGGSFICLEPTHNNIFFKLIRNFIYRKNSLFDEDTEEAFDLKTLNQSFENNHFRISNQIYPGLLSYILYYNPDAFPLLNLGGRSLVKLLFNIDRLFFTNSVGKFFSFATLTNLTKIKDA